MRLTLLTLSIAVLLGSAKVAAQDRLCSDASQIDFLQTCTDGIQFDEGHAEQELACKKISRWSKKRRSWLLATKPAKQWNGIAGGREASFEHVVSVGAACRMIFKYQISSVTKANGRKLPEETGHLVGRVHNNVFVGHIEQDNFDRRGVFSLLLDDTGQVFTGSVEMAKPRARQLGKAANWTGQRQ